MLKDVTLYFTNHAYTVSVVARNQSGFDNLISLKGESGFINPVKVDYSDNEFFKEKLQNSINTFGEFETVVSWIHSYAESSHKIIAGITGNGNAFCNYYHVTGSADQDPLNISVNTEESFKKYENISYRKIILGFVKEENNSRWLTDTEISSGVIDAVNYDKKLHVVGTIEPWKDRP